LLQSGSKVHVRLKQQPLQFAPLLDDVLFELAVLAVSISGEVRRFSIPANCTRAAPNASTSSTRSAADIQVWLPERLVHG
jgi:hypothetical protein